MSCLILWKHIWPETTHKFTQLNKVCNENVPEGNTTFYRHANSSTKWHVSLCFEGKVVQCKLTFKPSELCYPLFAKMPQRLLCSIYCGQMKSAQTTSVSGYRIVIGLLARTGLSNLSNLNRESRHQWGQLQWLMSLVSRLAMHHRVGVTFLALSVLRDL